MNHCVSCIQQTFSPNGESVCNYKSNTGKKLKCKSKKISESRGVSSTKNNVTPSGSNTYQKCIFSHMRKAVMDSNNSFRKYVSKMSTLRNFERETAYKSNLSGNLKSIQKVKQDNSICNVKVMLKKTDISSYTGDDEKYQASTTIKKMNNVKQNLNSRSRNETVNTHLCNKKLQFTKKSDVKLEQDYYENPITYDARSELGDTINNNAQRNVKNKTYNLKNILNEIPEKCGFLFKIYKENSVTFRCTKCKRRFKYAKNAAIHYSNCKYPQIKRFPLSFSKKDIEWICLQCRYHCSNLKNLKNHKKSCFITLSDSVSSAYIDIQKCIQNYSDACRIVCKTCCYACLSPISFNKHSCEERLNRMRSCYVLLKKLGDYENSFIFETETMSYKQETSSQPYIMHAEHIDEEEYVKLDIKVDISQTINHSSLDTCINQVSKTFDMNEETSIQRKNLPLVTSAEAFTNKMHDQKLNNNNNTTLVIPDNSEKMSSHKEFPSNMCRISPCLSNNKMNAESSKNESYNGGSLNSDEKQCFTGLHGLFPIQYHIAVPEKHQTLTLLSSTADDDSPLLDTANT